MVEVFEIRFVENDDDVFRDAFNETIDLLLAGQRASGIVWVRDEDEARLWCDGRDHRIEVVSQIGARHLDRPRAENRRDQFVGDEGVLRRDHVVTAIEKGVPEKLDKFIRYAAENEV